MRINIPALSASGGKPFLPELLKSGEIWLVGGAVRDSLITQIANSKSQTVISVKDLDFAVKGNAIKFAKSLSRSIGGTFVLLDKENDEARVVYTPKIPRYKKQDTNNKTQKEDMTLDFNGMQSIEEDLRRRDYTIDAIAASLSELEIIDPLNGIKDIKQKTIRMVSEKNITDDPLRILRAFRLSAKLGFKIEPKTMTALVKHRKLLKNIAGERIREELFGILNSENAYKTLQIMARHNILQTIIPETRRLDKMEGKLKGTLMDHSILTVRKFEENTESFSKYTCQKLHLLKLGCLLHDIGKPYCYSKDKGKVHFYGHETKGVRLLERIRESLRLSNADFRSLSNLIQYHMRPHLLATERIPTIKAICRLVRDGGDDTIGILLLAYADALASGGRGKIKLMSLVNNGIKMWEEMRQPKFKRLITGNDLIKLGFTPGPLFKEILQTIEELQISKELTTYNQAITYIKKNWSLKLVLPCALARGKKKGNNTRLQPKK